MQAGAFYLVIKTHWAQIQEVTFTAGMKFLFWIYRLLGRLPFQIALYPVVFFYFILQSHARSASIQYLKHMNLSLSQSFQHFMTFAESMLDKMLLWGGLFNFKHIQFYGREFILENLQQKRGGLLICSHLGNVELCRLLSQRVPDFKLTVLMHTHHAKAFNQLLLQLNPDSQINVLQVTDISPATIMLFTEKINQGEFIVIAGDRIPVSLHPRIATVPFLGEETAFPVGPYILGNLLQCPVYLLFALRTKAGADIYFEPFCDKIQLPRKNRQAALSQLASQFADRLGYYCMKAPLQWFNFYKFWKT